MRSNSGSMSFKVTLYADSYGMLGCAVAVPQLPETDLVTEGCHLYCVKARLILPRGRFRRVVS